MSDFERWRLPWERLGVAAPGSVYDRLIASYSEPHRRYHTLQHIEECLHVFAEASSLALRPDEVEIAIWFHDAVYIPARKDNEEKSAHWARAAIIDAGLPEAVSNRVRELVIATGHRKIPGEHDARILVDVDLSIFGASPVRFDEYERQIREEYADVDEALFRSARKEIVTLFLTRPYIYCTEYFRRTRESFARINLRRALDRL